MGGTAPYQYSINDGANWTSDSSFTSLGNGIFSIKARNVDSSCVSTLANNPVIFSAQGIDIQVVKTDINCPTSVTGSIEINADGGTGSFEYSIDNGLNWSLNNTFSTLLLGAYTIKVRNSDGSCENSYVSNPVIVNNNAWNFNISSTNPSCIGTFNGSLSFDLGGQTGNFEYTIDNGINWNSTANFTNLDTGTYILKVRIDNGDCETAYSSNPVLLQAIPISVSATSVSGGLCQWYV